MANQRDEVAQQIKVTLNGAYADHGRPDRRTVAAQLERAERLLEQAHELAAQND